jgi:hypothetical protein
MKRLTIIFLTLICLAFQTTDYNTEFSGVVLTETHFGDLDLTQLNNENIGSKVKSAFPELRMTKKTGKQDGPDFDFYLMSNEEMENIFFISMDGYDSTTVQTLWTKNKEIEDQYGVQVHQTTAELLKKRPNLRFHSDLHYNIYASENGSRIEYGLSGDFKAINDSTFVSNDYSVDKWQVEKMYVELIQWRK